LESVIVEAMSAKIIVIAHNIRSAHNVGSLLRTCEGLGIEKLIMSGYTPYPLSDHDKRMPHIARKVSAQIEKTALGAETFQKWHHEADIDKLIKELSGAGYSICALEQSPDASRLDKFKTPDKLVLILGSEVGGLDKTILRKAEHILEIPMSGHKESFNVVQSAAMALYQFRFGG
jgi:tRNA G18 (ribose-2'-O)-methylase SpoU